LPKKLVIDFAPAAAAAFFAAFAALPDAFGAVFCRCCFRLLQDRTQTPS
jgi:hypothetical protein